MTVWMEEGCLAGSTLAVDQAFIMQMLLPAFETVVYLGIRRVARALPTGEARIITGIAA